MGFERLRGLELRGRKAERRRGEEAWRGVEGKVCRGEKFIMHEGEEVKLGDLCSCHHGVVNISWSAFWFGVL